MDQTTAKNLEIQFHSANYQTIMETISGLRSAAGHLIKVHVVCVCVCGIYTLYIHIPLYITLLCFSPPPWKTMGSGSDRSVLLQLADDSVASFLTRVLEIEHLPHSMSVLQEIGIHRYIYTQLHTGTFTCTRTYNNQPRNIYS